MQPKAFLKEAQKEMEGKGFDVPYLNTVIKIENNDIWEEDSVESYAFR